MFFVFAFGCPHSPWVDNKIMMVTSGAGPIWGFLCKLVDSPDRKFFLKSFGMKVGFRKLQLV